MQAGSQMQAKASEAAQSVKDATGMNKWASRRAPTRIFFFELGSIMMERKNPKLLT